MWLTVNERFCWSRKSAVWLLIIACMLQNKYIARLTKSATCIFHIFQLRKKLRELAFSSSLLWPFSGVAVQYIWIALDHTTRKSIHNFFTGPLTKQMRPIWTASRASKMQVSALCKALFCIGAVQVHTTLKWKLVKVSLVEFMWSQSACTLTS